MIRLKSWPSAATSAFFLSGLEVLAVVWYLTIRRQSIDASSFLLPSFAYAGFVILAIGLHAETTTLWSMSRRQRITPFASHLSRIGIAIYVATTVVLILLIILRGFAPSSDRALGAWVFQVPRIPEALTFGLLGSTCNGSSLLERLASIALIVVALIGFASAGRTMLGGEVEEARGWLPAIHISVRAVMWVAVGIWLRTAAIREHTQPTQ